MPEIMRPELVNLTDAEVEAVSGGQDARGGNGGAGGAGGNATATNTTATNTTPTPA